jgi:hypothetical protein
MPVLTVGMSAQPVSTMAYAVAVKHDRTARPSQKAILAIATRGQQAKLDAAE